MLAAIRHADRSNQLRPGGRSLTGPFGPQRSTVPAPLRTGPYVHVRAFVASRLTHGLVRSRQRKSVVLHWLPESSSQAPIPLGRPGPKFDSTAKPFFSLQVYQHRGEAVRLNSALPLLPFSYYYSICYSGFVTKQGPPQATPRCTRSPAFEGQQRRNATSTSSKTLSIMASTALSGFGCS